MTTVDDLPDSTQMKKGLTPEERQEQWKEKQERQKEQHDKWINAVCEEYKTYLLACCQHSIHQSRGGEYLTVAVDFNHKFCAGGVFQFPHYGNYRRGGYRFQDRVPFSETRDPFRELQSELYQKKGWVLLDESDPQRSHGSYIRLYPKLPPHYETTPLLWHKKNKLPEDVERFRRHLTIQPPQMAKMDAV